MILCDAFKYASTDLPAPNSTVEYLAVEASLDLTVKNNTVFTFSLDEGPVVGCCSVFR
jgi:hypothetical protein